MPIPVKKIHLIKIIVLSVCASLTLHVHQALGWHDQTHLAVSKAAGYEKWYNASGADMTKIKAGAIEAYNHFFNNTFNREVTPELVFKQIRKYNNPRNREGHLYGAIIASFREYKNAIEEGKYAEYHLAFCIHYITDLSQPLHNIPYDDFNRSHHVASDGIVNREALESMDKIKKHMYPVHLRQDRLEEDLAKEISGIANLSRQLGHRLNKENRNMTKKEAYVQLGRSASLIKALLEHMRRQTGQAVIQR